MIKSKIYGFLFLSLFLIGGVYVLSESAYGGSPSSDLGCCLVITPGTQVTACKGCSGDPPCQRTRGFCTAPNDNFFNTQFCSTVGGVDAFCTPTAPEGCCEFDPDDDDDCDIETEGRCDGRTPPGDWTFGVECNADAELCGDDPTGCCVTGLDDDDDAECVPNETELGCEEGLSGQWTIGGRCDVTLTCLGEEPVLSSSVPTMSQWGLIATAGTMALFSLFYMIRRHRYNLS